jgi:murein DD-endopeptidase MepM/ murein hydrolase activator NlpD
MRLPLVAGSWTKNQSTRVLAYRGDNIRFSYWDKRPSGIHRTCDVDGAIDGEKIVAMFAGKIVRNGNEGGDGWGRYSKMDTTIGGAARSILIAHCKRVAYAAGKTLGEGDGWAFVDCTGNCSGAHLHPELWAKAGDRSSSTDMFGVLHQMFDSEHGVHPIRNPYPPPSGSYILKRGQIGPPIHFVQWALGDSNIPGLFTSDGIYDAPLEARVRKFQKAEGLKVDGQVGKQTLAALKQVTR